MLEFDSLAAKPVTGSQTLLRGLDVLEAVSLGFTTLQGLSSHLGMSRSTVYRLATALVKRDYLLVQPRGGYRLGGKLMQLAEVSAASPET